MTAKTHWRKNFNYKYLASDELVQPGDVTLTIDRVTREDVVGEGGRKEECPVAYFKEKSKPMVLNRTNCKAITRVNGSPYIEDWPGTRIALYVDHNVKLKGDIVDGIRVRPVKPLDTTPATPEQIAEIEALLEMKPNTERADNIKAKYKTFDQDTAQHAITWLTEH